MNIPIKPPCVNSPEDDALVFVSEKQKNREEELIRIVSKSNSVSHEQHQQEINTQYKSSFPFVQAVPGIFINTDLVPNYRDLL